MKLFDKKFWKKWPIYFLTEKDLSRDKKFIRILTCSMIEVNLAAWQRQKKEENR